MCTPRCKREHVWLAWVSQLQAWYKLARRVSAAGAKCPTKLLCCANKYHGKRTKTVSNVMWNRVLIRYAESPRAKLSNSNTKLNYLKVITLIVQTFMSYFWMHPLRCCLFTLARHRSNQSSSCCTANRHKRATQLCFWCNSHWQFTHGHCRWSGETMESGNFPRVFVTLVECIPPLFQHQ